MSVPPLNTKLMVKYHAGHRGVKRGARLFGRTAPAQQKVDVAFAPSQHLTYPVKLLRHSEGGVKRQISPRACYFAGTHTKVARAGSKSGQYWSK